MGLNSSFRRKVASYKPAGYDGPALPSTKLSSYSLCNNYLGFSDQAAEEDS